MRRLRCVLLALLVAGLLATAGCWSPFQKTSDQTDASSAPINPAWVPAYVDEEVGPVLDVDTLVENVAPTVVSIVTQTLTRDIFFQVVPEEGAGSGVIIDPKGYIVTNNHVVEGAKTVEVTLSDGRAFNAVRWTTDATTDLAVVQIEAGADLPYAHFLSNSLGKLKVLHPVIAVGNALALQGGPTWTDGTVSHLGRSIQLTDGTVLDNLIQTNAAINPGNSGGPLFNMSGQVVGIDVAIAQGYENIGFAISTDTAIPVLNSLVKEKVVPSAWLGVSILTVSPVVKSRYSLSVDSGACIVEVTADSPAARAGLQANDVIVSLDSQPITSAEDLTTAMRSHESGDTVSITFYRGDQQKTTTATLAQRPSS